MGVLFICDGCGKSEAGLYSNRCWHKPKHWYQRADDDGAQIACSRECIETIAEVTGKTDVVLPF